MRNGLSTAADLTLQAYCLWYLRSLRRALRKYDSRHVRPQSVLSIKARITFLAAIIEVFLVTYLLLIWLQNYWWYARGPELWIAFQSMSIVCTVCIPVACFCLLVLEQIRSMHKKYRKMRNAGDSFVSTTLTSVASLRPTAGIPAAAE